MLLAKWWWQRHHRFIYHSGFDHQYHLYGDLHRPRRNGKPSINSHRGCGVSRSCCQRNRNTVIDFKRRNLGGLLDINQQHVMYRTQWWYRHYGVVYYPGIDYKYHLYGDLHRPRWNSKPGFNSHRNCGASCARSYCQPYRDTVIDFKRRNLGGLLDINQQHFMYRTQWWHRHHRVVYHPCIDHQHHLYGDLHRTRGDGKPEHNGYRNYGTSYTRSYCQPYRDTVLDYKRRNLDRFLDINQQYFMYRTQWWYRHYRVVYHSGIDDQHRLYCNVPGRRWLN